MRNQKAERGLILTKLPLVTVAAVVWEKYASALGTLKK